MGVTAIEWTGTPRNGVIEPGYSWSPWWGCTRVSAGCANCYAADIAQRFRGLEYKRGVPRQLTKNWTAPLAWNRKAERDGVRRKVFPSMCDVFDEEVPAEWLGRFFSLVCQTPHLDWLVLTKRADRMREMIDHYHNSLFRPDGLGIIESLWLGVSVENQAAADLRIPLLLQTPAAVRFLSVEPLLGPVDIIRTLPSEDQVALGRGHPCEIDWAIIGGESGKNRRDCGVEAIADVARQCTDAGVPTFIKQDCALRPGQQGRLSDNLWALKEFPR